MKMRTDQPDRFDLSADHDSAGLVGLGFGWVAGLYFTGKSFTWILAEG
jgi:hypothetical protein